MASKTKHRLCPESRLSEMFATLRTDPVRGAKDLEGLLAHYPEDARLHFMRGSLLAGEQDYAAARTAMRRAVDLAPDYPIARFQLGLLLLTCGEAYPAQETWGPLHNLPRDHYLRLFVEGLMCLVRDDFAGTIRLLEQGIAANHENPPLNRDMQMVIDEVRAKSGGMTKGAASSVDLLLQQAALKSTRH